MTRRAFSKGALLGALGGLLPRWLQAAPGWPEHPFLSGNYAPVAESERGEQQPGEITVAGKLPPGLRGRYLRNGPNPAFPPRGRYHWFDGDGMVHAVTLGERPSYRARFVETRCLQEERKAGKALWGGLLDPPFVSAPPKGLGRDKNPANIALLRHHGKLLALWEGGAPYELRPDDLGTVGRYTFSGTLGHALTAHPKVDPKTGRLHAFGYRLAPKPPWLYYSVFAPDGALVSKRTIDLPRPVMMHDFAITERYAVFLDLPQVFSFARLMTGRAPFAFEAQRGARIGLLPLDGSGEPRWFEDEACWVFHTVGAFEEGDEVVLLGARYPAFPGGLSLGAGGGGDRARLVEWRLNTATGKLRRRFVGEETLELPRIDERLTGRPFTRAWAVASDQRFLLQIERDSPGNRGKDRVVRYAADGPCDEPVFAPDPARPGKGWVLTLCYRPEKNESELLVLDPDHFADGPVARVELGTRVPHGLHGIWMPA